VTPAQVVLRWNVELGITVIPRSARPEHIESNLNLFGFSLTGEDLARLNRL
jgi:2,5-diketo-D-gluconate reductase A